MRPTVFATGQLRCYDGSGREVPCRGTGQDGWFQRGLPWPKPRFADSGDTVEDLLTGLTWTKNANPAEFPLTWEEALERLREMNASRHLGHGDWRPPRRREMRSLLSHQSTKPPLPEGHPFARVFQGWYWTATPYAADPSFLWYVHLGGGRTFAGRKDRYSLLWPVRGASGALSPPEPAPRFLAEEDAVQDRLTGLLWSRRADSAGGPMRWEEALAAVDALNEREGTARWRLPNISELESLVDLRRFGPALPERHPFLGVGEVCWSSTTSTYETDWAWALYLDRGAVGVGRKDFARFSVWPVGDMT